MVLEAFLSKTDNVRFDMPSGLTGSDVITHDVTTGAG